MSSQSPPEGPEAQLILPTAEHLALWALDDDLFGREFFPEEFKQSTPRFHHKIGRLLNDQLNRYVGVMMYRGSAKTTRIRVFTAKRIAFGISHTVAIVSLAQAHAITNLTWLKNRIDDPAGRLRAVFGLARGRKWSEDHIEVDNQSLGQYINIVAKGMTGQIRGLNVEGHRPDLIVADDISDDETTGTPEAREKARSLFFGGLMQSLVPATENPDAKAVLAQTPLQEDDIISTAVKDPTWASLVIGCFDEVGDSTWEDRFPTADLRIERESYVRKGLLRIWLAEKECRLVGGENTDFQSNWLKYWSTLPERMATFISIDPVPPPSERALRMGLQDNDFEVLSAVGIGPDGYYLLEQVGNRGHDPEWTIATFFSLCERWKPLDVTVEGVAYQRTLKYILEKAMRERRRYVPVKIMADDKRRKRHRIVQSLAGIASQGRLFVHPQHADFQAQFLAYPGVSHDDYLDSAAMGLERAQQYDSGMLPGGGFLDEQSDGPLEISWRKAP
jgi:hypothetical protein